MKYIFNKSKREKVKMVIDAFNNAKIVEQNIPFLKPHNRVPDKNYNDTNVYITLNDIEEYTKNPKKVTNRLSRIYNNNKRYTQKKSEYITEIDFTENLDLNGNPQQLGNTIKDYIINKFNNISSKEIEYIFESTKEDSWSNINKYGFYSNPHQEYGELEYFIDMYFYITKYEENRVLVYHEPYTNFYINVVKRNNHQEYKSYLKITIEEKLKFEFVIIV